MDQAPSPLISIGVPTYNRPEGLRRTLECLSQQTYQNLEILVSDNCSAGTATADVAAEIAAHDPRIKYFRQHKQLGATGNFRFVLRQARGEYFMWAADDDEWKPAFVERCHAALQTGASSAMTGFETSYRARKTRELGLMPKLDPSKTTASNFCAFLSQLTPSLFYGLHRRNRILFFLEEGLFDYYDCYFVLRLIVNGGVVVIPEILYTAGVDAPEYVVKTTTQSWGSGLKYLPFYRATRSLITEASANGHDRLKLETKLTILLIRLFMSNEIRALIRRLKQGGDRTTNAN